jgi:hypothetical protein
VVVGEIEQYTREYLLKIIIVAAGEEKGQPSGVVLGVEENLVLVVLVAELGV